MARKATLADLPRINEIRRQVNELHVKGRPDVFRPRFCDELRDHAAEMITGEDCAILVAERDGTVCGIAGVNVVARPLSPYNLPRTYFRVEELAVDAGYRRRGVGTELFEAVRELAREHGCQKIELDMWEFNADALQFYEALGFRTYRRYLEFDEDGASGGKAARTDG